MKSKSGTIGGRTAAGSVLVVSARLLTRFIDLGTVLLLARILLPTDFGLVALAMSLVFLVEAIMELPINQALIRLPTVTKHHYDTAFTLGLLRGILLSGILLAASWPFARAYGDIRLVSLICFLSLAPAARGMISPRLAEYQKKMSFWRDFVIEISSKLVSFAVSLAVAILTRSYWAIAVGSVLYPVTMAVQSYRLAPYRPVLSVSEHKVFSTFIGWMSGAQVLGALSWQCERLLLGQIKPLAEVGLFSNASDLATIPFAAMFNPIMRPLLAAFSRLRDEPDRLASSYVNAANALVAVGLPMLVGVSLVAEPIVRVILGPNWLAEVPLVQGLSLSLIPALFTLPSGSLILAFDRPQLFLRRSALEFVVKLPLVIAGGILFGFSGIIASRLITEVLSDLYGVLIVRRLIGVSIGRQILGPWRSILATAAMASGVTLMSGVFTAETEFGQSLARLAITSAAGAAAYSLASGALWLAAGRPHGMEAIIAAAVLNGARRARALLRRFAAQHAPGA